MTIVRTDIDLDSIVFAAGGHRSIEDGACIMEMVSYLAGEPWSDAPQCVAPSIRSFCMGWNDALPDAERTRLLRPYLTKVIGTNTGNPEHELQRFWMLADWTVRTSTPAWLRLAGLEDDARVLERLSELKTVDDLTRAQPLLEAAREHARAAGDAARDAAWDAAWAAARAAAWDAARAAARDAARDAARAAARDAAGDAARDAAGDAAWAAAWDAAGAAAREKLAPTVASLQASACELLDRLCAVGREDAAA